MRHGSFPFRESDDVLLLLILLCFLLLAVFLVLLVYTVCLETINLLFALDEYSIKFKINIFLTDI